MIGLDLVRSWVEGAMDSDRHAARESGSELAPTAYGRGRMDALIDMHAFLMRAQERLQPPEETHDRT